MKKIYDKTLNKEYLKITFCTIDGYSSTTFIQSLNKKKDLHVLSTNINIIRKGKFFLQFLQDIQLNIYNNTKRNQITSKKDL